MIFISIIHQSFQERILLYSVFPQYETNGEAEFYYMIKKTRTNVQGLNTLLISIKSNLSVCTSPSNISYKETRVSPTAASVHL